jgi:hypothetical protein
MSIRNIFRNILAANKIMKAHKLYELEKFEEANDVLSGLEGVQKHMDTILPDYLILQGEIAYKLNDINNAADKFAKFLEKVPDMPLNNDERKYLIFYVLEWLNHLSSLEGYKKVSSGNIGNIEKRIGMTSEINLENVSKSLKDYFPTNFDQTIDLKKIFN